MSDGSRKEAGIGFGDHAVHGRGNFWGECGAPHCNQWEVYGVAVRKCVNQTVGAAVWGGALEGGDAACSQITLRNIL